MPRRKNLIDRLSIFPTIIVSSIMNAGLVAIVLSLGWYSWPAIGGAWALGMGLIVRLAGGVTG